MLILLNMIREEWRVHSSSFGNFMFALFPVMLAAFSFGGSLILPFFRALIPSGQIIMLAHYMFVIFGVSVGAFGLLGREIMNRRFGQASMIAYSARTLPVSEKTLFLNFLIKDAIYYFVLWIFPFAAGFMLASPLLSISMVYPITALLTFTLSFLIGLSAAFFLSTVYAYSGKVFIGMLALSALLLPAVNYFNTGLPEMLPPLSFFLAPSFTQLAISLLLIIISSFISLLFLKIDYPEKGKRRFKNSLDRIAGFAGVFSYPYFISKDFLDLGRSEGGLGKIIFSFLFPLALVWLFLSFLLKIMPGANPLLVFSLFLGIISSSIYNWLTEFDLASSYSFLPVRISSIIKGKISSYAIINIISIVILVAAALYANQPAYFLPALFSFLAISSYALSITVYFSGLRPNILLYSAKIFLMYLFSISPVLLFLILLSLSNPFYLLFSIALAPVSFFILERSYNKWDSSEQPSF